MEEKHKSQFSINSVNQDDQEQHQQYDSYVVQQGDSVTKIAFKFNMNIAELIRINNIWGDYVYPKQIIKVAKPADDKHAAIHNSAFQSSQIKHNSNSHYQILEEEKKEDDFPLRNRGSLSPDIKGDSLSTLIDRTEKFGLESMQNEKGEISNIEHIYKKVFDEFANFSQNFAKKAPQPKGDLQDFLSMFDQVKQDPKLQEFKDEDYVEVSDYLKYDKDKNLKTEAYYVTKLAQVKGVLTCNNQYMQFDPVTCPENEMDEDFLNTFQALFDYQDIESLEILKLINEPALLTENTFIKSVYKYDFLIQINLTAVNGLTLKTEQESKKKITRSKVPIANIFMKFSHKDLDGMILTNKNQKKIVKSLKEKLEDYMKNVKETNESNTFVPYYDIILEDQVKSNLGEIPMSTLIADRVKSQTIKNNFITKDSRQSNQLIQYVPNKSDKSEILNDYQISAIVSNLPSMYKTMDWQLLYSLNRDGVSLQTFFEKCKFYRTTLVIVQDTNNAVFGGFCTETWKPFSKFYGTGENFLFTFKTGNDPTVFTWTGLDDQFQWANEQSIGLGGGQRGRFGLYLKDNFLKGSSSKTTTFDNDVLSSNQDFICAMLEVWGFD